MWRTAPRYGYNAPMKYSLRSLMTFSIRDVLLMTVIVAILVAWWLDHRRQHVAREELADKLRMYEEVLTKSRRGQFIGSDKNSDYYKLEFFSVEPLPNSSALPNKYELPK